jgi:pyridoxamine 5'-phosphate oxidase
MTRWLPFDVADCDASPFVQFRRWYDEAAGVMAEREAVTLVTATADARPSARMVLLRRVSEDSFGWYTNYESRKAHELAENPRAALLWYCEAQGRQIRVEGAVTRTSAEDSDAYFATRARRSQIGAHASHQSTPLASREALENRVELLEAEFAGTDVPRPANWGGYVLAPDAFEFWQHRENRLHDRVLYHLSDGRWSFERYAP